MKNILIISDIPLKCLLSFGAESFVLQVAIFFYLFLRFFQHLYIMLDSRYVPMCISTGFYTNLDLQNANKLYYITFTTIGICHTVYCYCLLAKL